MSLPADVTRCMGTNPECPMRWGCARFRDIPENVDLSWARSLNPADLPGCEYFVPFIREGMTTTHD